MRKPLATALCNGGEMRYGRERDLRDWLRSQEIDAIRGQGEDSRPGRGIVKAMQGYRSRFPLETPQEVDASVDAGRGEYRTMLRKLQSDEICRASRSNTSRAC